MTHPPKLIHDLIEFLNKDFNKFALDARPQCAPTGSRVICNPPILTTDEDWLVYVPEGLQDKATKFLEDAGATHSLEQEVYPDGVCYRYGDLNPVLIWDWSIYYRWVATTYYASKLNLMSKDERTRMFSALVDSRVPISELLLVKQS